MVALLLDEEPGAAEHFDRDQPLRLVRDDTETGEFPPSPWRRSRHNAANPGASAPATPTSGVSEGARHPRVGISDPIAARSPVASVPVAGSISPIASRRSVARPAVAGNDSASAARSPIRRWAAGAAPRPVVGAPSAPHVTPPTTHVGAPLPPPVLPGVRAVHPGHGGAVVGLVTGLVSHASQTRPGDRHVQEVAGLAQRDPSR